MYVKTKVPIREFSGRILGWIEDDGQGNQQIRDFVGHILGSYRKSEDKTRDFYGRIIGSGNLLTMLLTPNK